MSLGPQYAVLLPQKLPKSNFYFLNTLKVLATTLNKILMFSTQKAAF